MKFDIAELERLAILLETKAATAQALAKEHTTLKELPDAARQTARYTNGIHFAAMCREAAKRLTARAKRSAFVAPSFLEAWTYAQEKHCTWPHGDVEAWWNHFESCGWVIGKGKAMVSWQRAADNGFRNWREKHPQQANPSHTATAGHRAKGDPDGWTEFLVKKGQQYKEYRYAADWMQTDFRKASR